MLKADLLISWINIEISSFFINFFHEFLEECVTRRNVAFCSAGNEIE